MGLFFREATIFFQLHQNFTKDIKLIYFTVESYEEILFYKVNMVSLSSFPK